MEISELFVEMDMLAPGPKPSQDLVRCIQCFEVTSDVKLGDDTSDRVFLLMGRSFPRDSGRRYVCLARCSPDGTTPVYSAIRFASEVIKDRNEDDSPLFDVSGYRILKSRFGLELIAFQILVSNALAFCM